MPWNSHTQEIQQWHGNDRAKMPEPCSDARCQFCGVWFGPPPERANAYARRTTERAQPARR